MKSSNVRDTDVPSVVVIRIGPRPFRATTKDGFADVRSSSL